MNEVMADNAVVTDCIKYAVNVGIVAGCLGVLGWLAMRQNLPKARRRPMTLGEALIAKHRKGISLIEVLMSIFILSIGVLGVAALFPLAHHLSNSGAVADRSATAGQASLRDFKVRAMNSVPTWRTPTGAMLTVTPSDTLVTSPLIPFTNSGPQKYCLDPRGVAHGVTQAFPAMAGAASSMQRITLCNQFSTVVISGQSHWVTGNAMQIPQADEVFMLQDDLHFTVDDNNPTAAPIQTMEASGEKRFANREFSWMATIVREKNGGPHFNLSVVIFNGRHKPAATDEVEVAVTMSGGIGGGDVRLVGTSTTGPAIEKLRPGQWIMLTHAERVAWYRVLASSEYDAVAYARDVTLAGRDWDTAGAYGSPKAIIMPGAVGVYERAILLTADSPY